MGIIQSVLKEEYERLQLLQKTYQQELAGYPKGAVSKRKRGDQFYLYLIYRQGEKVVTDYVGNWDSEEAHLLRKRVADRKELESKTKQVNKDLLELRRALRG